MQRMRVLTIGFLLLSLSTFAQGKQDQWMEAFKKGDTKQAEKAARILQAAPEFSQMSPVASQALANFASFEIYQEEAYRIALNTDPADMIAKLDRHLALFRARVLEVGDASVARVGAGILLRTFKQLKGDGVELTRLSTELMGRSFAPDCPSYAEGAAYIKDLAELVDIAPFAVRARLATFQKNCSVAKTDLGQRALQYRVESLDILAGFHELSRLSLRANRGSTPRMPLAEREKLRARLRAVETEAANLLLERSGAEGEESFNQRLLAFEAQLNGTEAPSASMPAAERDVRLASARDAFESLQRVREGNSSLVIYLERLNTADIGLWLRDVQGRVEAGALDRQATVLMFLRFAEKESYLPWRTEWARTAERLVAARGSGKKLEGFSASIGGLRALMETRESEVRAWLTAFGLDTPLDEVSGETFAKRLVAKERVLASHFPLFQSLYSQIDRIQTNRVALAQAAASFEENNRKMGADPALEIVRQAQGDAAAQTLVTACYALTTTPFPARLPKELKLDWTTESYSLQDACKAISSASENAAFEANVWDYMVKRRFELSWDWNRVSKGWLGFRVGSEWVSLGAQSAVETSFTIPIVVGSFGVGEVVGKVASMAVKEWATAYAARMAANKVLTYALTKTLPAVAYGISGGVTFTVIKRMGYAAENAAARMMGFEAGKPLYNSKLSLYDNYALDVLFGSTGYFFALPWYTFVGKTVESAMAFRGLPAELTVKYLPGQVVKIPMGPLAGKLGVAGNKTREQLVYYFGQAGIDCIPFFSVPYVDRWIQAQAKLTKDPVLRGILDDATNYFRAYQFSLGYRILWVRYGPWLARRFPTLMQREGLTTPPVDAMAKQSWLLPKGTTH